MAVPFFNLTRQVAEEKQDLLNAFSSVLDSGAFILGQNVAAFEKELAAFCGCRFAVGVASGTDALHLALRAAGVTSGDEVITTPFTFVATANAIQYVGAKPVFADIEPDTFNLDPAEVAKKITAKTKAIIPVHLFGLAANLAPLLELSTRHNLAIIEDACQAIGATFRDKSVGGIGTAGAFSFFPTKNLGGFGDGGAITTNDEKLYTAARTLRAIGSRRQYYYEEIGFNSRLDELQAAILRLRLKKLPGWIKRRQENAAFYFSELKTVSQIKLPVEPAYAKPTFNQFSIRAKKRDELFSFLKNKQIGSMIYYPLSLHLQEAYSFLGYSAGAFPESEKAQKEILSLPIFPELTRTELIEVVSAIRSFYG